VIMDSGQPLRGFRNDADTLANALGSRFGRGPNF
jgi:hypothetical protein